MVNERGDFEYPSFPPHKPATAFKKDKTYLLSFFFNYFVFCTLIIGEPAHLIIKSFSVWFFKPNFKSNDWRISRIIPSLIRVHRRSLYMISVLRSSSIGSYKRLHRSVSVWVRNN